jgi:hypothetical protein
MIDYRKYINALRKCAKEHENDRTYTGHIIVSDLCHDTVNLLESLEQDTSDTLINIQTLKDQMIKYGFNAPDMTVTEFVEDLFSVKSLEQEPKIGYCKDCKWWKDSDGVYRRGGDAESQCPINRREVFDGNGYCYMYDQQESEE